MALAILLSVAVLLWASFLLLTMREVRTGARFFEAPRKALDWRVMRVSALIREVRVSKLVAHMVTVFAERLVHELAHVTLVAVQALERFLARMVHRLQGRRISTPRTRARIQLEQAFRYAKRAIHLKRKPVEQAPRSDIE